MEMRKKGTTSEPPEILSDLESSQIHGWARAKYRGLTALEIRELIEECLDWHRANGKGRVDWIATCRNWIRKEMRYKRERARAVSQAKPQAKVSESAPGRLLDLVDRIGKRA